MKISAAAKEYLIEIEVRKYTPKTIRSYRNNLNLFLRFCEEEAGVTEIEYVSLAVVRQFSRFMSEQGKRQGQSSLCLLKLYLNALFRQVQIVFVSEMNGAVKIYAQIYLQAPAE